MPGPPRCHAPRSTDSSSALTAKRKVRPISPMARYPAQLMSQSRKRSRTEKRRGASAVALSGGGAGEVTKGFYALGAQPSAKEAHGHRIHGASLATSRGKPAKRATDRSPRRKPWV